MPFEGRLSLEKANLGRVHWRCSVVVVVLQRVAKGYGNGEGGRTKTNTDKVVDLVKWRRRESKGVVGGSSLAVDGWKGVPFVGTIV